MHIEANVFVGKFLRTLFANANIDDREEVRLSVCRLLQALGLVKIEVTIERSEAIRLACFPTEELEHILRDNDDNNNNNNNDNDNSNNNDNNNDNNNNNNDDDDEGRTAKSRRCASFYKKI